MIEFLRKTAFVVGYLVIIELGILLIVVPLWKFLDELASEIRAAYWRRKSLKRRKEK